MSKDAKTGTVYLVGAGPGDTGLVTLRAKGLIESADCIVYDSLANPQLLDWAKAGCEKIYVGKTPGRHSISQEEIESVLVEHARKGRSVVRLKGGDPFIFGRGGEEVERMEADGIRFEIVPGVTAALASAAYTGIPLTHREHSSTVTFLTGHENPEKHTLSVDFRKYGKLNGTLCVYMGIGQLPRIVRELCEGGMPGSTPAAVVQWASLNRQRSFFASLGTLVDEVEAAGLGAPAVVIFGEVVAHRSQSSWFEDRPLFGRRIVVTRAQKQAGELTALLEALGAEILELPFIEVQQYVDPTVLGEVFAGIAIYEWIVFTSVNGVNHFFDFFHRAFDDIRCLGPMRIAAVGKATARAIEAHKLKVDLVPEQSNGDALADALIAEGGIDGVKMLVVTGNRNREDLVSRLTGEGRAIVDTLPLYATKKTDLTDHPAAERYRREGADAILFTSSSTVNSFIEQEAALRLEPGARQPVFGSIGPLTSKTLKERGLPIAFEAPTSSLDSFVEATSDHFDQ